MDKWLAQNIVTIIVGIISVYAMYCAPIVALRLQKKIEADDDQKERKLNIFKVLMSTRAEPVSAEHVKSLNMIDVEFYNDREITDTWSIYRDHLNSYPSSPSETDQKLWNERTTEYLTNLLYEMAKLLGYRFDKVLLKKGAYAPIAHDILNLEQAAIRGGFVQLLSGNKSIKVELLNNFWAISNTEEKSKAIEAQHEPSDS